MTLAATKSPDGSLDVRYTADIFPVGSRVRIALVSARRADQVSRGENSGRELHHSNVVREFASQKAQSSGKFTIQAPYEGPLTLVTYLQEGKSWRILGGARLDL